MLPRDASTLPPPRRSRSFRNDANVSASATSLELAPSRVFSFQRVALEFFEKTKKENNSRTQRSSDNLAAGEKCSELF